MRKRERTETAHTIICVMEAKLRLKWDEN